MTGGDISRSDHFRIIQQFLPLDPAVAFDAGIRGSSLQVFLRKRGRNITLKVLYAVYGKKPDSLGLRRTSCIIDGAAAAFSAVTGLPGTERGADHFVSGFLQKRCGNRTVHPSGHPDKHFFQTSHLKNFRLCGYRTKGAE